jgi:hypothetical protein
MKYLKLHPWNVDYKKAAEIQVRLQKSIILKCATKALNILLVQMFLTCLKEPSNPVTARINISGKLAGVVRRY